MGGEERVKIVLADPQGSGLYNKIKNGIMFNATEREGTRRRHRIDTIVEGIGINRVTANLEADIEFIGHAIQVTDEEALSMARWPVKNDGIFVGSSSCVDCEFHSPLRIPCFTQLRFRFCSRETCKSHGSWPQDCYNPV